MAGFPRAWSGRFLFMDDHFSGAPQCAAALSLLRQPKFSSTISHLVAHHMSLISKKYLKPSSRKYLQQRATNPFRINNCGNRAPLPNTCWSPRKAWPATNSFATASAAFFSPPTCWAPSRAFPQNATNPDWSAAAEISTSPSLFTFPQPSTGSSCRARREGFPTIQVAGSITLALGMEDAVRPVEDSFGDLAARLGATLKPGRPVTSKRKFFAQPAHTAVVQAR
jgi:hypothetical protein